MRYIKENATALDGCCAVLKYAALCRISCRYCFFSFYLWFCRNFIPQRTKYFFNGSIKKIEISVQPSLDRNNQSIVLGVRIWKSFVHCMCSCYIVDFTHKFCILPRKLDKETCKNSMICYKWVTHKCRCSIQYCYRFIRYRQPNSYNNGNNKEQREKICVEFTKRNDWREKKQRRRQRQRWQHERGCTNRSKKQHTTIPRTTETNKSTVW